MRDMLLIVIVAAMFAGGYFIMDKLDRVLKTLRPHEELYRDEPEAEISQPSQVENQCLLCYNALCEKRVQHPAARRCGQEERTWKQPGRTRTCFCVPSGKIARHQGS